MSEALIIGGRRTPRGRGKDTGSLHALHPQELLAQVLNRISADLGIETADVDDVVMGNGSNENDHGADIARLAALVAGWPVSVPGVTLNRFCGSGQQAIAFAAMGIGSGMQDLVVAGGVESMSRYGPGSVGSTLDGHNPRLRSMHPVVPQGISADLIATIEGMSRRDVDEFAAQSQGRAQAAIANGYFDASIFPVYNLDGTVALDHEEHPRPGTTAAALSALEPSFEALGQRIVPGYDRPFDQMALEVYPQLERIEHVHHAGNSSGVVDCAAAVVLASSRYARAHGLVARARFMTHAVAGSEPVIMLTGPGPASQMALTRAGMSVDDIDLWEINEAFAAVPLKVIRDLKLDPDRVNVNGGAIALGHPIGATGAILVQTALDELERRDLSTALITMCTGAGMATASIIERV